MILGLFIYLPLALLGCVAASPNGWDRVQACYAEELPPLRANPMAREIPWGTPSVHFSSLNGTLSTCCESLDGVREALDEIDKQFLELLNRRMAYVQEATRFKHTRESVNVPARNKQIVERAKREAVRLGMPVSVAKAVYETVLKAGIRFEECIFDEYEESCKSL
ncbi:uncharacterized protein CIMG_01980 [Coccidioides immitis RS]|uniref:Chorismate mutase domain-containing protein n=3 Tax=Coccidioides immitis TaxID=5501 RepID=J3KKD7_COCIM|nr:uncharacterized protein CIMG_01980 [Coccidioides immitis RS]EAS36626.3 hypothetical protein CIMG_01980 [Coccidioides immitis RS]TPX25284.1 hypothetical protein DIZ76_010735 [Coccidioides immitis]